MNILERLADKNMGMGDGILYSIICVIVVFAVLAIIIFASYGASKLVDHMENKGSEEPKNSPAPVASEPKNTNITDDDMMAAVLVATIDYRKEVK